MSRGHSHQIAKLKQTVTVTDRQTDREGQTVKYSKQRFYLLLGSGRGPQNSSLCTGSSGRPNRPSLVPSLSALSNAFDNLNVTLTLSGRWWLLGGLMKKVPGWR